MNFIGKYVVALACGAVISTSGANVEAQKKKSDKKNVKTELNDCDTPLHLLKPDYGFEYGVPTMESVKATLDRIADYLESVTPAYLVDANGNRVEIKDADENAKIAKGDFRLTSYEWGVTYSAMLCAGFTTGDAKYINYALDRIKLLGNATRHFKRMYENDGKLNAAFAGLVKPKALDDCGAIANSMMKARFFDKNLNLDDVITGLADYVLYSQYRLSDGTLARTRPQYNTVWLDDMYMGLPCMQGFADIENDDRTRQISYQQFRRFVEHMWVEEKGLFRHGWVENMVPRNFFWGRANGWAMLTMCELLDRVRTPNDKAYLLEMLNKHVAGVFALQSHEGTWHQLLDRNDTYLESSCTAIFCACAARAINKGWIDAAAYTPQVLLAWNALQKYITDKGRVEGTCVGTGMGFDPAFYAYRPVSASAAHGYGPMIMAGTEIYELLKNFAPRTNDSAVQLYRQQPLTNEPIFYVSDPSRPSKMDAGFTRQPGKKVVFLVGDSTMKNGRGLGDGNMWGWGSWFHLFVDSTYATVENHGLGGRSSRSYITEGLWDEVLAGVKAGDLVIVQWGHNDGGPIATGRARASLKGIGNESEMHIMQRSGREEKVVTYGAYLRRYIREVKAKGADVVVMSYTPKNRWANNKINRCDDTHGLWTKQVAEQENVPYIDVNSMAADIYDSMGKEKGEEYFEDNVHTNYAGAVLHCEIIARELAKITTNLVKTKAFEIPASDAQPAGFRNRFGGRSAAPAAKRDKSGDLRSIADPK